MVDDNGFLDRFKILGTRSTSIVQFSYVACFEVFVLKRLYAFCFDVSLKWFEMGLT
jgi:hypothetical protein